jgi:probable HAF family extracellular repeat protein
VGLFGSATVGDHGHGFLYSSGVFTPIDVPGASGGTWALGISATGQIVGYFDNGAGVHGFLDTGGVFTTIDVPGASYTDVDGINATGQMVGYFVNSGGHGFLDMGGVLTPIDVPGASLTGAFGINASGQIVGEFFDNAGTHIHGFLAAPAGVPAPSTLLLLGTGLASGAAWARFRRRSGARQRRSSFASRWFLLNH